MLVVSISSEEIFRRRLKTIRASGRSVRSARGIE
jgi:hypothetical protein